MESLLLALKTVFRAPSLLVKIFRLCLSTSTYFSCLKFGHIQPVSKTSDRSNPSNYCLKALISCLSKAFESVFNKKVMRHQITPFTLIASMVSVKADLLMILLFQLNLGHPLLGTSVKSLLSALTYRKPSIESGINL